MARRQETALHPLHAPARSGSASAETLLTRVLHTLGAVTIASCRWPLAALGASRDGAASGVVQEVFATGVQALPLVCVVGAGAGAGIVLQTGIMAPPPSGELGRMLVVVVLRELTPLVTAIVVAGHSGAALATDHRGVGASRVLGMVVSMLALTVYFGAVAIVAGYLTSQLLTLRSFDAVRDGFQQELRVLDLLLFFVKGAGLGAIVAWSAQRGPAENASTQPIAVSVRRAFATSVLGCMAYSGAVTLVFYALVGPPAPP